MNKLFTIKSLITILLLFVIQVGNLWGQDNKPENIPDSLLITSTRLDTTKAIWMTGKWKYHPGDDSVWAEKNFDDSAWDSLNTAIIMDSLKKGEWTGIGWFRKAFKIDSTLYHKTIGVIIGQAGASEIYFNGKLVKSYGTISDTANRDIAYNPQRIPFVVVLDSSPVQQIAVRYSNMRAEEFFQRYRGWADRAGFSFAIEQTDFSILAKLKSLMMNYLILITIGAILLAFTVLHLLMYFFYSRDKGNLFYAFFTGSTVVFFASSLFSQNTHAVSDITHIINIMPIVFITVMFASYNFFLYSIFYDKMPKQSWGILIVGLLLSIILIFFVSENWMLNYVFGPFLLLLTVEGLRVIALAVKRRKRNSVIIGMGVLIFFLFIIYIPVSNMLSIKMPGWFTLVFFYFGFLSLPVSMTIFLARESARTKNDLEKRILEVQELSQKAIEQEKREADLRIEKEKARVENERKSKELEEARQMQLSMLPKEIPHFTNLEIATYTKPATEVGGDYYDFMKSEDGTLTLLIGDATGHGLKAGTMVTASKSLFNSLGGKADVVEILREFNSSLYKMKLYNLAMCMSILKIRDNKLDIASAGMPPALIYRNATGQVDEILLKGMSLGSIKEFPYYKESIDLHPGDLILMMSDGFPERFTSEMVMIDYDKGKEILKGIGSKSPNEVIDYFVKYGDDWAKGHPQEDDVTFVAVKIK